jgi:hypothetical protein
VQVTAIVRVHSSFPRFDFAHLKYRREKKMRGRSLVKRAVTTTHPDDIRINDMKGRLDALRSQRAAKNVVIEARFREQSERDEAAQAAYRRTYRTEAELEADAREALVRKYQDLRAALERDEEPPGRSAEVEEEALERRCLVCDHNLSIFTLTVHRMSAEQHDSANRRERREAEARSAARSVELALGSIARQAVEGRVYVERDEAAAWRAIVELAAGGRKRAAAAAAERARVEHDRAVATAAAAEERRQRDAEDEVESMYAAMAARWDKLGSKYHDQQ